MFYAAGSSTETRWDDEHKPLDAAESTHETRRTKLPGSKHLSWAEQQAQLPEHFSDQLIEAAKRRHFSSREHWRALLDKYLRPSEH